VKKRNANTKGKWEGFPKAGSRRFRENEAMFVQEAFQVGFRKGPERGRVTVHWVDPLPEYMEEVRNDPLAGPLREDLAADGSEDEMWVALGVVHRSTD
jgi:hypothetical protein